MLSSYHISAIRFAFSVSASLTLCFAIPASPLTQWQVTLRIDYDEGAPNICRKDSEWSDQAIQWLMPLP